MLVVNESSIGTFCESGAILFGWFDLDMGFIDRNKGVCDCGTTRFAKTRSSSLCGTKVSRVSLEVVRLDFVNEQVKFQNLDLKVK